MQNDPETKEQQWRKTHHHHVLLQTQRSVGVTEKNSKETIIEIIYFSEYRKSDYSYGLPKLDSVE
jgi:hypothetical protein